MAYNRVSVIAPLLALQASQDGKPYSEMSPPGSAGDGHYWELGDPTPNYFDCSGFEHWSWANFGVAIGEGSAIDQWNASVGGRVALSAIEPGDTLYFNGSDPPVGHTGTCVAFNAGTGEGTFRSAYDTTDGVCLQPFSIHVTTGPGGMVGAVRTANNLPAPPPPAPTEEIVNPVITKDPNNGGYVVLDTAQGTWNGISDPATLAYLNGTCKIPIVTAPTGAVFANFKQVGTI